VAGSAPRRRWLRALLGVPLIGKLAGANAVIVVSAVGVALATHTDDSASVRLVALLAGTLLAALLVNLVLVYLALRPLQELEATAARVSRGDLAARVPPSPLADRDVARVGGTLNLLLDGLTAEHARVRRLAADVISSGDRERARIARELHDSTAQSLAALMFQLSAAARDSQDPELAKRLAAMKGLAAEVLEEVRTLAHAVHPRVLDDLGLPAALQNLAREMGARHTGVEIEVAAGAGAERLPPTTAAVLYRVAQEGVSNALRHGTPRTIDISASVDDHAAVLEITDDGTGFDVAEAQRRRPGMGLFSMRERVALVDGDLELVSRPGLGTRILVTVPLHPSAL
jgi:signal transduction histidine kinase